MNLVPRKFDFRRLKYFAVNAVAQIYSVRATAFKVLVASAICVGIVLLLHLQTGMPTANFTRDPVAVLDGPLLTGFLSQVGILFWAGMTAICLFMTCIIVPRISNAKVRNFFLTSGFVLLLLGLDDAFLIHEVLSEYQGIPETLIYGSYAGLVLWWLIRFSSIIFKSEYALLGMGLLFFSLSVVLDVVQPDVRGLTLFEDSAKLVGILSWQAYFFRLGVSVIRRNTSVNSMLSPAPPAKI